MKPEDKLSFLTLFTIGAEVYSKKLSEPLLEFYWRALQPFSFTAVQRAVHQHLENPGPGQFIFKLADIIGNIDGSYNLRAARAWSKVLRAMESVGAYQTVVFDDVLIHAVIIDIGGWIRLCHTSYRELPFCAREFEKRYSDYLQHPPITYPKQLSGFMEDSTYLRFSHNTTPKLIGNAEKALAVLEGRFIPAHLLTNQIDPLQSALTRLETDENKQTEQTHG